MERLLTSPLLEQLCVEMFSFLYVQRDEEVAHNHTNQLLAPPVLYYGQGMRTHLSGAAISRMRRFYSTFLPAPMAWIC